MYLFILFFVCLLQFSAGSKKKISNIWLIYCVAQKEIIFIIILPKKSLLPCIQLELLSCCALLISSVG